MLTFDLSRLQRKLTRRLNHLTNDTLEMLPLPFHEGRPRVLYFIVAYPTFSETYMHEEIRNLSNHYNIRIITYKRSDRPRRRAWQYTLIDYRMPCLVYSPVEKVNLNFDDPEQVDFLRRVDAVIEEFRPDVLHGHYLGIGVLLKKLAEKHRIPFTLRTHSMDVLSEPDNKLDAYCQVANSPWCARVLAFPASRVRLIDHRLNPDKVAACWPVINFPQFYKPERRPPTRRVMSGGPAIRKKAHNDFVDLAFMMRGRSDLQFDLYAGGPTLKATHEYNRGRGNPVLITYVDPEEMPAVYTEYDWLVYPSDSNINKVGLPVSIAEAMASGIGVCWQELPGRREEQLDFLGGAGFLFRSMDELPDILSQPYPEEKRLLGFEAARRCDIEGHKHLLTDVWDRLIPGAEL